MARGWAPNLSWITPDLAIGGSFPAEQAACLAGLEGVGAVIDVRSERCDDRGTLEACGLDFLHLPTPDHHAVPQELLDQGIAFAAHARATGRRLLIHCEHGIGRSATVALCVLVDRGMEPLQALKRAKDARTLVSPSPAQYEAWMTWLRRRAPAALPPTFDAFQAVAYRHLQARA